jgi:hypothetical protein
VILTGPRRSGKTTLLRRLFPAASYRLLEDPDLLQRVRADPRTFFDELTTPAILDEIQNAPELFSYVRTRVDRHPRRAGQWFLTGSQEAALMRGVTESMAGRAAVLSLWPLSTLETDKVTMLRGGFPEALARPRALLVPRPTGARGGLHRTGLGRRDRAGRGEGRANHDAGDGVVARAATEGTAAGTAATLLVHRAPAAGSDTRALAPGVRAVDVAGMLESLVARARTSVPRR